MDTPSLMDRRKATIARRRAPGGLQLLEISAFADGDLGPENRPKPSDLRLETTFPDGRIATWFSDQWWLELLRRWKDRPLTIHILPTPESLLHPIVVHELEMVRRMLTPWRLIGYCYLSDIGHPMQLSRVAVNQYDEIRIIDEERPATDGYDVQPSKLSLDDVLARVRTIQRDERVCRPLFTRAPVPRAVGVDD